MYKTKVIKIGHKKIGGNNPVLVQSMCNTDTRDIKATVKQIKELEKMGCEIIRVAVLDMKAARAIKKIKKQINIPLVADIHFDYRLAIESVKQGADKIRINPGNIGSLENLRKVVKACQNKKIPIRVGVNSGSLEQDVLKKYKMRVTPQGLVDSALKNIKLLEKMNFRNMVVSIKSTNVAHTIKAYEMIARKISYPLHLGVTEAGPPSVGIIKSSIGIGALLAQGIGDTIRVSLTGDSAEEVRVGWEILKSLKLRKKGVEIISCPTCGRTQIDLPKLVNQVEKALKDIKKEITVAVMGCAVNGPGEAREADIGVAGGKKTGIIFRRGKVIKTVKEKDILKELLKEIKKL
ncbi:MAG: flavodoxin-dependent (E)-4-hydroxy-3-methylbut-2-enyl-diphosphate synthase [Patescibacteria group bacterium]|nr:flavodoxin-dependent (E)-4-hydroxy-3-methylbut-2-enyl-diphosphate synthase [Patescibacteria group bacterium]